MEQTEKKEKTFTPMTMIPIPAATLQGVKPNDGATRARIPVGDYRFKMTKVEQQVKEGERPHVMARVSFVVVNAYDQANSSAVGMETNGLYAGSVQSPKFLQERLVCLLQAAKVQPGPQGINVSDLVGREIDATIVFELSDPEVDNFGRSTGKRYVNDRIKGERPVGAPPSSKLNAKAESQAALGYLAQLEGGGAPAQQFGWEGGTAQGGTAGATVVTPDAFDTGSANAEPASEGDDAEQATIHNYRAMVQMGHPAGEAAKTSLEAAGVDPNGEINESLLTEDIGRQWSEYRVKKAASNGGIAGLPPLAKKRATKTTPPAQS